MSSSLTRGHQPQYSPKQQFRTDDYPKKNDTSTLDKEKNLHYPIDISIWKRKWHFINLTQIHTCLYDKFRPKFEFKWLIPISKECTCHVQLKLALWPTFSTRLWNEVLLFCYYWTQLIPHQPGIFWAIFVWNYPNGHWKEELKLLPVIFLYFIIVSSWSGALSTWTFFAKECCTQSIVKIINPFNSSWEDENMKSSDNNANPCQHQFWSDKLTFNHN